MGSLIINLAAYRAELSNPIGLLVQWIMSFVGSYALTVILFTVAIKLLLTPLDYWQKLSGRQNAKKMEKMKPQLDKIKEKYGADRNTLYLKQKEVHDKEGYKPMMSCLPLLVTLLIVIFMFTGLNAFASYKQISEFNKIEAVYNTAATAGLRDYNAAYIAAHGAIPDEVQNQTDAGYDEYYAYLDGKLAAAEQSGQAAVLSYYGENTQTFLWIKNVWRQDTFWTSPVLTATDFKSIVGKNETVDAAAYNKIMGGVNASDFAKGTNGLLLLPLIALFLSFFTQKITAQMQSSMQMPGANSDMMKQQTKMMQYMMPIMIGVFSLFYTAAVALYFVVNSVMTLLISFAINKLVDKRMENEVQSNQGRGYRR
jgi:YidC/Oxa1 family membrane protein insertase